jgi:hypothetical protein
MHLADLVFSYVNRDMVRPKSVFLQVFFAKAVKFFHACCPKYVSVTFDVVFLIY